MNFHDIGGSCVYTNTDDGGLLGLDALRCHVVFSDRRFDHFSPHYYYLKGLLFCFWLILQPPGDRNHDVGLGQAWPAFYLCCPAKFSILLISDCL